MLGPIGFGTVHTAKLENKAQDIVRIAADAVLETHKNDILKDFDKKRKSSKSLISVWEIVSTCHPFQKKISITMLRTA